MDERSLQLAEGLVTPRYIQAGVESLHSNERVLRSLVAQRQCPENGLPDPLIEHLLTQLAMMDTNNFACHIGGGEREGRVISVLVQRRTFYLTHGVGRSGDLTSDQPKAAGSSLMYQLTNMMILDLLKLAGAKATKAALVVPMATGMTLSLVLRSLRKDREREEEEAAAGSSSPPPLQCSEGMAKRMYVIWPRIDQKTALKCIDTAGLVPLPVPLRHAPRQRGSRKPPHQQRLGGKQQGGDTRTTAVAMDNEGEHAHGTQGEKEKKAGARATTMCSGSTSNSSALHPYFLQCHVDDITAAIEEAGGREHVLCVLTTTSCFAPRLPDDIIAIAQLCKRLNIAHVVNNAYGVQSRGIMNKLDAAQRDGRVDFYVQSGDKNFLVPVGGAVVASAEKYSLLSHVAATYAGRASAAPIIDLFITVLGLGRAGMQQLWHARYERRRELAARLHRFAAARGEVLITEEYTDGDCTSVGSEKENAAVAATAVASPLPRNDISFSMTMWRYAEAIALHEGAKKKEKKQQFFEGVESNPLQVFLGDESPDVASNTAAAAAQAFGAKLFRSGVTGPRVVVPAYDTVTRIAGCSFFSYGTHQDHPRCPMLVLACGIGMTEAEVQALMAKLEQLWPPLPV